MRDGINLTAAVINPVGTVSGTVDATGCNIGVFYGPGFSGTVTGATVENANYFGIVNDGGNVSVTGSTITNIGETPFNGAQHGVGIYFAVEGNSVGTINSNTVEHYQKNGIVVNGVGSSATISGNTVTGEGPVNYIAQNGIEVGYGATASVTRNNVSGNAYTGPNFASSGGILVFGGPGFGGAYTTHVNVVNNTLTNNDVGIYLYNADSSFNAPTTKTQNTAVNNTITNDAFTNTTGNGGGYQVGIADLGNKDNIVNNAISGAGYAPQALPSFGALIDTTGSIVKSNIINAVK